MDIELKILPCPLCYCLFRDLVYTRISTRKPEVIPCWLDSSAVRLRCSLRTAHLLTFFRYNQYHPDVSKDSQAAEVFKTVRQAYDVLSNEITRTKYDRALKFQKDDSRPYRGNYNYSPEYDDEIRVYKWANLRRKMQYEQYRKRYNVNMKNSSFYGETTDEEDEDEDVVEEETLDEDGSSFIEVLKSAFISLFLLKTFGSLFSLTFTSLTALFDRKLDSGYKIGYVIAWILGGRGGVLLTLCLSFASWVCGKTSSSVVVLVVVAMWVGSNLARYAPLPQGALLTLIYMSIKLQVDLR